MPELYVQVYRISRVVLARLRSEIMPEVQPVHLP